MPAFSTALAFYDGYRSARLPANLLQAQRDYFGAHTYERVDKPRGQVLPHQLDRHRRQSLGEHLHGLTGGGVPLSPGPRRGFFLPAAPPAAAAR